jgi:hypothetical protein
MKACTDCQRHYVSWEGYELHLCADSANPVDGVATRNPCAVMRGLRGKCGPDARLFVPKPPESFLKRLARVLKEYL